MYRSMRLDGRVKLLSYTDSVLQVDCALTHPTDQVNLILTRSVHLLRILNITPCSYIKAEDARITALDKRVYRSITILDNRPAYTLC